MCDEMSDTQHEIEMLRFQVGELQHEINEKLNLLRELMWRDGVEDEIQRLDADIDKAIAEQAKLLNKIVDLKEIEQ